MLKTSDAESSRPRRSVRQHFGKEVPSFRRVRLSICRWPGFSRAGRVSRGQMETSCTYMLLPGRCCRTPILVSHVSRLRTCARPGPRGFGSFWKASRPERETTLVSQSRSSRLLRLRPHGADALSQRAGPGAAGAKVSQRALGPCCALQVQRLFKEQAEISDHSDAAAALRHSSIKWNEGGFIGRWLPA